MSRLATISDSTGTLAAYTYLGAGTMASEDLPQPQVSWIIRPTISRRWTASATSWISSGRPMAATPATRARWTATRYTYDRSGNRTSASERTDAALSELYGYDSLDRLTSPCAARFRRRDQARPRVPDLDARQPGQLHRFQRQQFHPDPHGRCGQRDSVDQRQRGHAGLRPGREHDHDAGADGAESTALTCAYDAWNRLVQVSNASEDLARYDYDGTGRRIVEFTDFTGTTPGTVTYSYYSGQNAIETRTGSLHLREGQGEGGLGRCPFNTNTSSRRLA